MVAREVSASRLHSNTTTSTSGGPANPLHQLPPPPHAAAVGLRHTSSSGSGSGSFGADDIGLQRASSMNLPKPEDSGVPATHPDMCILRIRRNHLVEVRALVLERGTKQMPSCLCEELGHACVVCVGCLIGTAPLPDLMPRWKTDQLIHALSSNE